jgi:hypothetical protein
MRWPTKTQTVSRARLIGDNPEVTYGGDLVVNNTFAGTDWADDWDGTLGVTLSRLFILVGPDGDSSNYLHVEKTGGVNPWAAYGAIDILTVGRRYRIGGWARSSNGNEEPRAFDTGVTVWTGTTSTSWQPLTGEFLATTTRIQWGGTGGGVGDGIHLYKPTVEPVVYAPVAIYDMKPATGVTVPDNSANLYDATIAGPNQRSTQIGSAMHFDGVDDYLDVTGIISTVQTYTFNMWLRSSMGATTLKYIMDFQTGRLILGFFSNGGNLGYFDGVAWREFGSPINDGLWHHLVWLFDDDNSEGTLYLDNAQYGATLTYAGVNLGGNVAIGALSNGTSNFLEADIAHISIYDELKSTDWIAEEYARGQLVGFHTDW